MSFGEGDLHARVDELEDQLSRVQGTCEDFACENVELNDRVEELERDNARLRELVSLKDRRLEEERKRFCELTNRNWKLKLLFCEQICDLIEELESLAVEMWPTVAMFMNDENRRNFRKRMDALGLQVGDVV